MQKLLYDKRRWLFLVFCSCFLLFAVWRTGTYLVNATNGVSPAATVSYTPSTDILFVADFKYYTTVNASKRVPAANYWIKTDIGSVSGTNRYGFVDLSGMPNDTTLYFSKSCSPASTDDILAVHIPAQPVLSKVKYKPAGTKLVENADGEEVEVDGDIKDKFEFYASIRMKKDGAYKTVQVPVDPKYIQIRLNDNNPWKPFNDVLTKNALDGMQRHGRTIYVRVAPATAYVVTTSDDVKEIVDQSLTINKVKTGRFEEVAEGDEETAVSIVRPGISKIVQIKRRSFGPAPSIDYANHALNIKAGQAYGSTSDGVEPASWTVAEEAEKVFFGNNGSVTANLVYGLKKAADTDRGIADSLTTFFKVPVDKPLQTYDTPQNESYVSVTGTYGGSAVIRIQNKYPGTSITFQYAVVDLNEDGANYGLLDGSKFNYSLAVQQIEDGDLKWYNLVTAKSTGKGLAKLSADLVDGKQIIVRRAATGKEYSSQVEIFRAPLEKGKGWYKIPQKKYVYSFQADTNPTGACACPYADITYKTDNLNVKNQFKITCMPGVTATANDKLSVKVGGKTNVPFTIVKDVITLTDVAAFEEGQEVVFTLKEGFTTAAAANGVTNAEYKITLVPKESVE